MEDVYVYDPDVNCGCCGDNTEINIDNGLCRDCEKIMKSDDKS